MHNMYTLCTIFTEHILHYLPVGVFFCSSCEYVTIVAETYIGFTKKKKKNDKGAFMKILGDHEKNLFSGGKKTKKGHSLQMRL